MESESSRMEEKNTVPPTAGEAPFNLFPGAFLKNGELFTAMKPRIIKRVRLKNRRVYLSYDGEKWGIDFRILIDRRSRKIQRAFFAISDEAMSALVALRLSPWPDLNPNPQGGNPWPANMKT